MSTTQVKSEEDQNMADTDSGVESTASASTSTTSIDQIQCRGNNTDRMKSLFYGQAADVMVEFPDGNAIHFNKFPLASKSRVFSAIFYNDTSAVPDIHVVSLDEDFESFKMFLDCFMGFQDITKKNIYVILPIVLKYEVAELLEKSKDLLVPDYLSEEVCLTLNAAIKYNCQALLVELIEFLTDDGRIHRIFDQERFYTLLEPDSVCRILNYAKIDSFVLEVLFKWAEFYLTKKGKPVNFKEFFTECKIVDKINLDCFESTSAIFNFNDSNLSRKYFSADDILSHIRVNGLNDCKSEWIKIQANIGSAFELEEDFTIDNLVELKGFKTILAVYRNPVVFYRISWDKKDMMSWNITCSINNTTTVCYIDELDFDCPDHSFVAVIPILEEADNVEIKIKIKWTFNYDCRILRSSPTFINDKENLFFTKNITAMYERTTPGN